MTATDSRNVELSGLFHRLRQGDRAVRNEIIGTLYDRIIRLTAVMLRTFPRVSQRREVESVTDQLVIKLMKLLDDPGFQVESESHFFRLAAKKLRELLLDETEKYRRGLPEVLQGSKSGSALPFEPGTDSMDPAALAEWTEFHKQVAELPEDERTIVEMHLFLGMAQSEIARVLEWEPKQVSRKWLKASLKLADYLPGM